LLFILKKLNKTLTRIKKTFLISLLIIFVLIVPQTINTFNKDAQARSRWVFAINPATINQIENNRNNYQGNPLIAKLKYNKVTVFSAVVVKNYLGFVNPKMLFFNSTQNFQFNIPNTGVLYSVCLPFFYVGLIILLINLFKKNKLSIFLISWFLIGLIPAVVTVGDFPIIRAMTILPLPQIFIVYGFIKTTSFFKNKKIKSFSTVWEISAVNDVSVSASFPTEIPIRCIRACSNPSDLILEPFAGSGTTIIASEQLGRQCRAIEISEKYCAVILERLSNLGLEPTLS